MRPEKEEHSLGIKPEAPVMDVFVVIRSAGEATEQLCLSLVKEQVGEGNVKVIREKPFVEAVRKTFTIGLVKNKKWTLAIDADILIREKAIADLVQWANKQEDYFFEFQGRVVDKFFCAPRPGGPHLYRTKYLEEAIGVLPICKNELRPESYTYHKMAEKGHHYFHHPEIYGIHDYFQYARDIYRKAFLHAHKHNQHVGYFAKQWSKNKNDDSDYEVALSGLFEGLCFQKEVEIDVDFFNNLFENKMAPAKINGQEIIVDNTKIQEIVSFWRQDKEAQQFERENMNLYRRSDEFVSKPKKINLSCHSKILWKAGDYINKIGNYFKHIAN